MVFWRSGGRSIESWVFMKRDIKFRRLTKAEAKRLGVSHAAKRRVDASLKRVTKSSKLYTDRQVAEINSGVKREVRAKQRKGVKGKNGVITFYHVTPSDFKRVASLASSHLTQIAAKGIEEKRSKFGGSAMPEFGPKWRISTMIAQDQLLHYLKAMHGPVGYGFMGFDQDNPPLDINVLVYPIGHV
jgi:hypothetical protein